MKKKTKNDLTLVQFVVRKNPKGISVIQLADGTTKIIIEVILFRNEKPALSSPMEREGAGLYLNKS